jgi:hypothetical protein
MTQLPTLADLQALSDSELATKYSAAVANGASSADAAVLVLRDEFRHREADRWHAELRLLLRVLLVVSIVGLVLLAWDAID